LDLIDPVVSGNKWFKLHYNLEAAVHRNNKGIITFGGAHSNHLLATAAAASRHGLKAIGLVRGWHGSRSSTPTLEACRAFGMALEFVSREDYAQRQTPAFLDELHRRFPECLIIPEGGANEEGILGCEQIAAWVPDDTTHVAVSVGTGTTLIGLRRALPASMQVWGFAPMKGGAYLEPALREPVAGKPFQLFDAWHFGGFGKWNEALVAFARDFHRETEIPLDLVYTAKMLFGIRELMQTGRIHDGARIVAVHTGGLQGNPTDLFAA
jgi:1-aminocyclopropane-1-carboxylate deaminase